MHENREISCTSWSADRDRSAKAINRKADTNVQEKSDCVVLPGNQPNKEGKRTMCFRIWDLRALSQADVTALKQTLNNIQDRKELAPAEKVHAKLDWANVRAHYDDVLYC